MRTMPEFWSRSDWNARSVSLEPIRTPLSDVFIHHTVGVPGPDFAAFMRETEAFHINSRGMRAIAYSHVVTEAVSAEGRGWGKAGGHTLDHNSTSHAVCAAGNFETQPASDALISTIAATIREGIRVGAVSPNPNIRGHRDVFATACPGANLYARLDDIRRAVIEGDEMPLTAADHEAIVIDAARGTAAAFGAKNVKQLQRWFAGLREDAGLAAQDDPDDRPETDEELRELLGLDT